MGLPLVVSFSGGETSAMMSYMIKTALGGKRKLVFLFANTGEENEETLRFVEACDKAWGLGVVWVEAVVTPGKGNGTRHKVVNYETASRNGEPFERVIEKYGIPNKAYPHCTRELKEHPMKAYVKSLNMGGHETAIGIRMDEVDRMGGKPGVVYPMISWWPSTKASVKAFWKEQPFGLALREHEGNCKWCWKKSDRKLLTLAAERPEIFDFPARMEREHAFTGTGDRDTEKHPGPYTFFRGGSSAVEILEQAKKGMFTPYREDVPAEQIDWVGMDAPGGGCGEDCDVTGPL